MIYPPRHFDLNEWIVIGFFLLTSLLAWRLERRFPLSLSLVMMVFASTTARVFDHILAVPVMADLYDIQDLNKVEWADLMTYLMYAPTGYIFVNLYDRWNLRGYKTPIYVLLWSLIATGIEWLFYKGHVFTYKEWSIAYSFVVYLFVSPVTLWLFEFLRARYKRIA
jgi:hypothetical protein